jgi:muramidase (phage lysozyme)
MAQQVQQQAPVIQAGMNMRKFSDLISKSEGTADYENPYAVGFGGTQIEDLSKHPGAMTKYKQTDGSTINTSAAGKHQFIGSTYADMAKKTGKKDFSPASQEANFTQLMKDKGVYDMISNGDFAGAINKLGSTFASLPSSKAAQPKKTWSEIAQMNQEIGGPKFQMPTFTGGVSPTNTPQRIAKTPNLSEEAIMTAALPSTQDNLDTAKQREDAQASANSDMIASADTQRMGQRQNEIEKMLSDAFGFDGLMTNKKSPASPYDAQLKKLIDIA